MNMTAMETGTFTVNGGETVYETTGYVDVVRAISNDANVLSDAEIRWIHSAVRQLRKDKSLSSIESVEFELVVYAADSRPNNVEFDYGY